MRLDSAYSVAGILTAKLFGRRVHFPNEDAMPGGCSCSPDNPPQKTKEKFSDEKGGCAHRVDISLMLSWSMGNVAASSQEAHNARMTTQPPLQVYLTPDKQGRTSALIIL